MLLTFREVQQMPFRGMIKKDLLKPFTVIIPNQTSNAPQEDFFRAPDW